MHADFPREGRAEDSLQPPGPPAVHPASAFVSREIDAEDMRRHRLRLTPAGRKMMHQGMTLLSDAFGERLGRLSAAQQEELRRLLEKMS
jgi:DNA-binding MarR family transcriptional regulator